MKFQHILSKEEKRLLNHTIKLSNKAGKRLLKSFRQERPLERGTVKEVKLVYDIIADEIIKESIEKYFPGHSYITEESGLIDRKSDYLWIIDPLDGTSNFADQNPIFCVSISLWREGQPLIGVIDAPMMQEKFIAVRGQGAFHQDLFRNKTRKASVSNVSRKSDAYGVYCEGGNTNKKQTLELLGKYYLQIKDTRKLGSAALELAFVGMGRTESYMTTKISLWDIAAGILFVKEAGGDILHLDGTPYTWDEFKPGKTYDLLATNGKVKIVL